MPERKTIWLQLNCQPEHCWATCWDSDSDDRFLLEQLKLAPDDVVKIPSLRPPHDEVEYTLRDLCQALIGFDAKNLHVAFEERGQICLGQHLWDETIGRLNRYESTADVDLRIITGDEHLGRLPWPLLARRGIFAVNKGWTVSLTSTPDHLPNVELPSSPKLLMVIPQPAQCRQTEGVEHRDELKRLLESVAPRMADPDHFHVVTTWEAYVRETGRNRYDIIYYYGHGGGNAMKSRLVFEAAGNEPRRTPMRDFAECMRKMETKLVYVNCCSGDAGGLLGAGRQLSGVTPCVVTNRTVASVSVARAQAMAFWRAVLLDGVSPHLAVARNYQSLGELNLNSTSPHWFTPVIHANYDVWKAYPPRAVKEYDKHWKLDLDRFDQFGRVVIKTQDMLEERSPRALAFLWYGDEGQGMERFHERLEVRLERRLQNAHVVEWRIGWPERYATSGVRAFSERAFEEKLLEAFDVGSLEEINGRVAKRAGNNKALIVLNHPHADKSDVMDPQRLLPYLHWWNQTVLRKLNDDAHSYVLGFSFRAKNAEKFRGALTQLGYDDLTLEKIHVEPLPPLENIKRHDLLDFLQRHKIFVPPKDKDRLLDYILDRTKGRYEATLLELETLVIRGYDEIAGRDENSSAESSNDPFGMDQE